MIQTKIQINAVQEIAMNRLWTEEEYKAGGKVVNIYFFFLSSDQHNYSYGYRNQNHQRYLTVQPPTQEQTSARGLCYMPG